MLNCFIIKKSRAHQNQRGDQTFIILCIIDASDTFFLQRRGKRKKDKAELLTDILRFSFSVKLRQTHQKQLKTEVFYATPALTKLHIVYNIIVADDSFCSSNSEEY